jgi:Uma2 family endonuclease
MWLDLFERTWTQDAYLALSEMCNYPIELSEGRLIIYEMPAPFHQLIVTNVWLILKRWATKFNTGRAYVAPMPVRLWPDKFREPDVMFYKTEHFDRIFEKYGGVPDLVVEVLSPHTANHDLGEKLLEYAQAGVPEYWIVDPTQGQLLVYVLRQQQFQLVSTLSRSARYRSQTLPKLAFDVRQIFDQ